MKGLSSDQQLKKKSTYFVHLHLAKTAGSALNRYLARRYHGVCGHKGYSFTQPWLDVKDNRTDPKFYRPKIGKTKKYGRDVVHPNRMMDWGLFNCALLSPEASMDQLEQQVRESFLTSVPKVALVPCREPVDHFLSECNMKHLNVTQLFQEGSCEKSASKCYIAHNRFNFSRLHIFEKVVLFKYDSFDAVANFLDEYLPIRAVQLENEGKVLRTNRLRQRESERLPGICSKARLEAHLRSEWEYYDFCDKLLGHELQVLMRGIDYPKKLGY